MPDDGQPETPASSLPSHIRDLFWTASEAQYGTERILGTDGGGEFYVDRDESIHWRPTAVGGSTRFVNSSIASFGDFLRSVDELRDVTGNMSDDLADETIRRERGRLERRDSVAFTDPDSWWSVIFEQLEDGLL